VDVAVPDTGHLLVHRDLGLNKTASEETVLSEATFLGTLPNVSEKQTSISNHYCKLQKNYPYS
jgi:hypothetical protein